MNSRSAVRCKLGAFNFNGRTVLALQRAGDPYDTARLVYDDEPGEELGRVVDLDRVRPQLATALAVWSSDQRVVALGQVRRVWQDYTMEVIA
jgi:hypothetical protein